MMIPIQPTKLIIYYDGLFDFVKTRDNSFGMILGVGVEVGILFINRPNKTEKAMEIVGEISPFV